MVYFYQLIIFALSIVYDFLVGYHLKGEITLYPNTCCIKILVKGLILNKCYCLFNTATNMFDHIIFSFHSVKRSVVEGKIYNRNTTISFLEIQIRSAIPINIYTAVFKFVMKDIFARQ